MIFKAIYRKQGGHFDVAVFVAPAENQTFARLGELTMDERDFRAFKRSVVLEQDHAQRPEFRHSWTFEEGS